MRRTAYFEPSKPDAPKQFSTKQLSDFPQDVCLVKCDTDGHDFEVIQENISWFGRCRPGLIIENQIRTNAHLDQANTMFSELVSVGYRNSLFYDDPGFMILGTDSLEQIQELNRYQFKLFEGEEHQKSIWNFDVLCCHETPTCLRLSEHITGRTDDLKRLDAYRTAHPPHRSRENEELYSQSQVAPHENAPWGDRDGNAMALGRIP